MEKMTEYGGIIGTMYSQFPEAEIPEEIKNYKERIDSLFRAECEYECRKQLDSFSEKERNYLSCIYLDEFFKIYKAIKKYTITEINEPMRTAIILKANEKILRFYLNLSRENNYGGILQFATLHNNEFVVKYILEKTKGKELYGGFENTYKENALIIAAQEGYLSLLNIFLQEGVYVKETALGQAAQNGHLSVVNRLLEIGKYNIKWALTCAAKNQHLDIVNKLIDNAGDFINIIDHYSAVQIMQTENTEIIRRLVDSGFLIPPQ